MTISIDKQVPAGNCDAHQPNDLHLPVAWGDYVCYVHTSFVLKGRYSSGFVFTDVDIANATPITAAHLSFYINDIAQDDPYVLIYGNDVDNANNFVDEAVLFNRPRTDAYATWYGSNLGEGWRDTPDIKSVIQEIVNRPGWSANNDMCLLGIGTYYGFTDLQVAVRAYDTYPTLAAKLHIEYEGVAAVELGADYQLLNLGVKVY